MLRLVVFVLAISVQPSAAAQAGADSQLLAELKAVRAALEKLDNGQKVLAALARIQIDESRVASLEAQRLQLLSSEQDHRKEAAATLRSLEGGSSPVALHTATGEESTAGADLTPLRNRLSQANQKAEEAARTRKGIEQAIAALRARIATLEKFVEESGR